MRISEVEMRLDTSARIGKSKRNILQTICGYLLLFTLSVPVGSDRPINLVSVIGPSLRLVRDNKRRFSRADAVRRLGRGLRNKGRPACTAR